MGSKQLILENIPVTLIDEHFAVRATSPDRNVLLLDQDIGTVIQLIGNDFKTVDSFYLKRMADHPESNLVPEDIHGLSVSIVLSYLYMHNMWRVDNKHKKNQDLSFKTKDFDHPSLHDHIFSYIKNKYPDDWEAKCGVLLGMEPDALKKYYERRVQFYNMF